MPVLAGTGKNACATRTDSFNRVVNEGVIGLTVDGITAARHDEKHDSVKVLAVRDIVEKVDGKDAKATSGEATGARKLLALWRSVAAKGRDSAT